MSDGKHPSWYTMFTINVLPLTLANHSVVSVRQTADVSVLAARHLGAATNGNRSQVFYNVARRTRHGQLQLRD